MSMSDPLLSELLAKPVGPATAPASPGSQTLTRQVEVGAEAATVTLKGKPEQATEDAAAAYLAEQGLSPDEWEATGFRSSEWTLPSGELGVSRRFTFARRGSAPAPIPIDELLAAIEQHDPRPIRQEDGEHGFLVLLGDMQFGKIDGDGAEGTLRRTIGCLDRAADLLETYRQRFDIGHVHVAWLGDHVEGFVSQGGANTWRTGLTLTEQIRLTRRVMLHAALTFAPLAGRLTMAAVPGNHGEAVRFGGKGLTRYDDSHDTESLISVADALALDKEQFGHVEFYVPDNDELVVVLDVAGTTVAHAHGHQWRPGKHWDWWKGQAFGDRLHGADLLVAGHLHHEFVDTDGPRTFIQVPSMESESTWWKHRTGASGAPGLIVAVTRGGQTNIKEVVRCPSV